MRSNGAKKPYRELSRAGQLRRLRSLAILALEEYGLSAPLLSFHCFDTNLLYRIADGEGKLYILRLGTPGWRTFTDLQLEAAWLEALEKETDIRVPHIYHATDGRTVIPITGEDVPGVWNATLMEYLPGRLLGKYLNPGNLEKMGELFARLHVHGGEWKAPENLTKRVFDYFLSREEPELLFEPAQLEAYTGDQFSVLHQVHVAVAEAYESLDRNDLRIIHCDLWHDNIKVHRGSLYPFDFEDTVTGFRLHDIAMAMLDLLEDTDDDAYPPLFQAFKRGYTRHLDWPAGHMEALMAGRVLWIINYVAVKERPYLSEVVKRHYETLLYFTKTGKILLRP